MKKSASFFVGAALLLSPLLVSAQSTDALIAQIQALLAQVQALQAQIQKLQSSGPQTTSPASSGTSSAATCPALSRVLSLGSSGPDVFSVQQFLIRAGAAGLTANGSFDLATEAAVRAWQSAHGIVSSGDAATTGWGIVGPKTRSLIAINCTNTLPTAASLSSCLPASAPTTMCSTGWKASTDANGCTVSYTCSVPLGSPTISGTSNTSGSSANTCTALSLACPAGTSLQVGANCAQSCVKNTAYSYTCSQVSPPYCPDGTLVSRGSDANSCSLGFDCVKKTPSASCPQFFPPQCSVSQHLVSGAYDNTTGCWGPPQCVAN